MTIHEHDRVSSNDDGSAAPATSTHALVDRLIDGEPYAVAFGDFRAAYTIAERPDLRILRDPFSAKPNVLFYANKRVGGDITDYAAIKLLKIAVS